MEGSERLDHDFCWRFFEIVVIVIRCLHFSRRFSDGGDSPVKDVPSLQLKAYNVGKWVSFRERVKAIHDGVDF